ncbi:peptidylprolyl isomerase [Alteraurantiacibacter buctensis]|uniref:Peptidylprolyl isomerase n=1 Tax=Alteraurantiacibacter buctensis TaxID=1503981 RepID=A0A844YZS1_9SPHN|nr:peptidylprolyl isomerase [Alteraurantiacibacter buctensis]MXO73059.1 peptidylprolyl isomerase [Alteraurantiacibacter buctensis]
MKRLLLALPLAFAIPAAAQEAEPPTPASVVAEAAPEEWVAIAPQDLLVMDLAPDAAGRARRVVIQLLPPPFSQPWVENIRTLARAHWWDGTQVYRVVDNWVAQWGAGEDGGEAGFIEHPLPEGVVSPVAEYVERNDSVLSPSIGRDVLFWDPSKSWPSVVEGLVAFRSHQNRIYETFIGGFPIAGSEGIHEGYVWPIHCYASVGVARDLAPDTGTGAELYAVIGHAPRQLDRNIAVVGRVIEGIEYLSTLPRGTAEAGVYATRAEDTPIVSVRLGNDLPDPPRFEYLGTQSESFARYVQVRANRHDAFYTVPAGGLDVCNVQVPIRWVAP